MVRTIKKNVIIGSVKVGEVHAPAFKTATEGVEFFNKHWSKKSDTSFDVLTYLNGRKEYLRAQLKIWESGTGKHDCTQARMFEITELINLIKAMKGDIK